MLSASRICRHRIKASASAWNESDVRLFAAIAEIARHSRKLKREAARDEESPHIDLHARDLRKVSDKPLAGGDVFANGDISIAAQITRYKAINLAPDAIFICTYTPGGASAIR
jgi:branched-chain amino acid transport system substrate-binding protein